MYKIEPVNMKDDKLVILDQTLLPGEEKYIEMDKAEDIYEAIKSLRVRGAPAIGVAAAIGLYAVVKSSGAADKTELTEKFRENAAYLKGSRPTAVNLGWAIGRMTACMDDARVRTDDTDEILSALKEEALKIRDEDIEACRSMGEHGLTLLEPGMGILTHCNAGILATAQYGTCLSPIYLGQEKGYDFHVYADETRPLLQGARLTSWELERSGVDVTLICDNMAATVMAQGKIDAVVVGCDRIAANGDAANKIGTMNLAILADHFSIPFYMFVPTSTIDLDTKTGDDIVIEEREGEEIYKMWYEKPMAPEGIKTFNPSFDVTPHRLISAVVTERGVVKQPYTQGLRIITGHKLGAIRGLKEAIITGIDGGPL